MKDKTEKSQETLQEGEEWMIVALPRDVARALVSFTGMSKKKIPQNPLTETGRLRSGPTVEFGRAIGELLALEAENWIVPDRRNQELWNIPDSDRECVSVPVIANRNESDILSFGDIRLMLCTLIARKKNAAIQRPSVTPDSTQKNPTRNPLKMAATVFLWVLASIGFIALIGMAINFDEVAKSTSQAQQIEKVTQNSANQQQSANQQSSQLSMIPESSLSVPLPPPSNLEVVLGGGGKRLFVFDDPLCPYCKRLEPSLKAMVKRGYEVHIFPTPIHSEARQLVAGIACAKDKAKAWDNAINKEMLFPGTCDGHDAAPDAALAFFRQFGFNATPTMVNEAGRVKVGGFESNDALAAFIEEK